MQIIQVFFVNNKICYCRLLNKKIKIKGYLR